MGLLLFTLYSAAATAVAAIVAGRGGDRQGQHGPFPLVLPSELHHVGRRGGLISRIKIFQAASTTATTSEGPWAFIVPHPFSVSH